MTLDDLKKLATGSVLFSLDRLIVPRLLKVIYLVGLVCIALWSINHIFFSFRFGFGQGLWGLIEAIAFGLAVFLGLRTLCELLLVYFRTNEKIVRDLSLAAPTASLIDDVRDAIEDLASEEDEGAQVVTPATKSSEAPKSSASKPRARAKSAKVSNNSKASKPPAKRTAPRKTARRSTKSPDA